jgi:hypothetical protein
VLKIIKMKIPKAKREKYKLYELDFKDEGFKLLPNGKYKKLSAKY